MFNFWDKVYFKLLNFTICELIFITTDELKGQKTAVFYLTFNKFVPYVFIFRDGASFPEPISQSAFNHIGKVTILVLNSFIPFLANNWI